MWQNVAPFKPLYYGKAVQRDAEDRWWALSTRGKSEHHRTGRRVMPGQGDLEESAAESRPPKVLDFR